MRILFYVYEWPPVGGGVANAAIELIKQFSLNEDFSLDVITLAADGKYRVDTSFRNINIYLLPLGDRRKRLQKQTIRDIIAYWLVSYIFTWRLIFKGHQYNLTHTFGYPGGWVSFLFSWKWPYVVSLRGVDVPGYNQKFTQWYVAYRQFARLIWKRAQSVVVNSQWLKKLAQKTAANLDYRIIENGVNSKKFQPIQKDSLRYKKFTVTAGATLMNSKKGLDELIKGYARFHKSQPYSQLLLVGDGPQKAELIALANKLKLKNTVKFVGRKDKDWLAINLPKCHVLCLPSKVEGMSNAILEGMACGLPIITTRPSGELIHENGIVLKSGNSEEITRALTQLYQNPKTLASMGQKSRRLIKSMNWEAVAEKYYQVYCDVLSVKQSQ